MSYRTMEVNGVTYEYVTGRTNTKIKGIGVFTNEEIGRIVHWMGECSCGSTYCDMAPVNEGLAVTPRVIKRLIEERTK